MPSSHSLKAVRKLCDPVWLRHRFARNAKQVTCELTVTSHMCGSLGQASEEEFTELVSSSFHQALRDTLPFPETLSSTLNTPGGIWFWETYRHALFGENVIVRLGGTAISLAEDCLAGQAELRAKACVDYTPSTERSRNLLAHGAAKLEIVYALSLSVALHVAKLPVLDRAQGPRAVVLCATHSQCAEFTAVLNHFCPSLHLVVHNLFEGYPSLPAEKRADVVVGTPPLWESVSQLAGGSSVINIDAAARLGGLEDLLVGLEDEAQLPPVYNLSRWRPYNLGYVEQLVLFDVELQVNMGFGTILHHIVQDENDPPSLFKGGGAVRANGRLPLSCQLYAVLGEDRWRIDHEAVEALLKAIRERGSASANGGSAEIALSSRFEEHHSTLTRKRPRGNETKGVPPAEELCRTKDDGRGSEEQPASSMELADASASAFPAQKAFDGLFIRNAISHTRLLADFDALTDFTQRVIDVAEEFWLCFEGVTHEERNAPVAIEDRSGRQANAGSQEAAKASAAVLRVIQVDLALICVRSAVGACSKEDEGESGDASASYRAQELGVWVHSGPSVTDTYASRATLLFKHLLDRLNGELFDGSVVQCVLAEDAARLPYDLRPLAFEAICARHLIQVEAFSYGVSLLRPLLLEISKKPVDQEVKAATERADERRCVTSTDGTGNSAQHRGEGSVPSSFFLLPRKKTVMTASFAPWRPPVPVDVGTVMVLRHLPLSRQQACGGTAAAESRPSNDMEKPFVLLVIEECCQYGRVLSYHVHEDVVQLPQASTEPTEQTCGTADAIEDTRRQDGEASKLGTHTAVLSLFIEYESSDSALEAARHFALRFAGDALRTPQLERRCPRVRFFRNATYYQGVLQDNQTTMQHDFGNAADDEGNDCFFADFLTESLLAD
jgi:hypothetical protein